MITMLAASLPLADNEFGDTQSDGVAGPMGLLIIVLLAIATVLLIRNMNRRIRRLPDRFTTDAESHDAPVSRPADRGQAPAEQVIDESRKD